MGSAPSTRPDVKTYDSHQNEEQPTIRRTEHSNNEHTKLDKDNGGKSSEINNGTSNGLQENADQGGSSNGRQQNALTEDKQENTPDTDKLSVALEPVSSNLQRLKINQHLRTEKGTVPMQEVYYIAKCLSMFGEDFDHGELIKRCTDLFEQNDTVVIICSYCNEYLTKHHPQEAEVAQVFSLFLHNFSNDNPKVCKVILQQEALMKTWKEKMKLWEAASVGDDKENPGDVMLVNILGTYHNISQVEDLVQQLRELGILEMVKPYLNSSADEIRLTSLAILANIVKEDESDILSANDGLMEFLINILAEALKSEKRTCYLGRSHWSLAEFALTIRMMARNDNNKKSLVSHGVIPLLIKVADSSDPKEQREAVGALWSLSFDKNNREIMINDNNCKAIETLQSLMSSENEQVKNICRRALWTMREDLVNSQRYKALGLQFMTVGKGEKEEDSNRRHVMISYNRSHRPLVSDIHNNIIKHQLNVWMDINDMHGSTVDAMAKAVENAEVVLVCYSPQYKNSDNCRAEAEYAYKLKKKILFLKMVSEYDPDGWLGFIIGSKKFYDFSGKYPFQQKLSELLKAIQLGYLSKEEIIKPADNQNALTAIPIHTPVVASSNNYQSQLECVQNWSKNEVEIWLEKNHINRKSFKSLEGYDVAFLCVLVNECPEFFYQTLREQLGIKDIHTMARLRFALNALNIRL